MDNPQHYMIHKKNTIIPIKHRLSEPIKINSAKGEYSLKQNVFDPSKSSPPNDFMIKLQIRMKKHYMDNNDVSCDIE
jgi:hypothetical protein